MTISQDHEPHTGSVTSGHTPGPWGLEVTSTSTWVGPLRADGEKVDDIVVHIDGGRGLGTGYREAFLAKQLANARLIASAPELLEALKEARVMVMTWAAYVGDYFRDKHGLADDMAKLDAAIAKAEGRQ